MNARRVASSAVFAAAVSVLVSLAAAPPAAAQGDPTCQILGPAGGYSVVATKKLEYDSVAGGNLIARDIRITGTGALTSCYGLPPYTCGVPDED